MPGCLELARKMTGSTSSGPPQPPKDAAPKAEQQQLRGKMTPRPESGQPGQPMQLTPLWEHVVRTRRFPMSVDAESTFREISDRLRDPEWEVRQHALRVLIDVLPVLDQHVVDKLMVSVVPELVTNLGHPAPAVRKGALDTLRVYLCYSQDKENMFQKILDEGFNRPDALDNFQSNVSMGMILSVPSLLFPSAGSPRPPEGVLRFAINALASRLVQVTHQEAAFRSLAKIREIVGAQEFDSHMLDYNANVKRDFEMLCEVYSVKIHQENEEKSKGETNGEEVKEIVPLIKEWSSDSDSSGATDDGRDEEEEQDDMLVAGPMPLARVVLETEIKFDEETAITMTILEEKEKESDTEKSDSDSDFDAEDAGVVQVLEDALPERRKTRRRVRFGGEIVKLRTPDSDEASIGKPEIPRTKIPLPLFPATKMPLDHRRAFSQPTSPTHSKHPKKRSLSSSPKREVYIHNALLSPKKSILTRPSSPLYVIQPVKPRKKDRKNRKKKTAAAANGGEKNPTSLKQIRETSEADETPAKNSEAKENDKPLSVAEEAMVLPEVKKETIKLVQNASEVQKFDVDVNAKDSGGDEGSGKIKEGLDTSKESPKRSSRPSSRVNFDVFPKQERNYILMELSSPERKKHAEKMNGLNEPGNDFSPFGAAVNDPVFGTEILTPKGEMAASDQLLSRIIDSVSTASSQTSGGSLSEATMIQRFPTTMKTDRSNTGDVVSKTVQELQGEKFHQDSRLPSSMSTVFIPKNSQALNEGVGQFKGGDKATSNSANKQNSESAGRMDRSFRELTSDSRNRSTPDESESLTCSSSEGEGHSQEPSWEELGLVDQETLNDLHNKDDWRARVRGLERLASALKTSSALAAVEPRLGSLLQAVLGGERSCRIAAAGMAVARVVIAGVSEDALRRRLPQLAWGLTRQGGPHAAQLARIAMLRLRPALLLEQLLQPHCLGARNGKTRENALQLLIFSLVTFPSTEFKVQTVARRVAETIGDRRRRVRQAALDTLAVLGQIYETQDVLEAGERAASGRHDSEAMKAAIRSRLARKSLPLVSADGLVVYGLQISPNVRIATGLLGADVDWIVAGSGSLSPGSGRSRGQLIGMTARLDSASIFRSESARSNPWTERSDLIAVQGVGVGSRDQPQPFAWQLVPAQNQDDQRPKEGVAWASEGQNVSTWIPNAPSAIRPFYLRPQQPLNATRTADQQTLFLNKNNPVEGRNFIGSNSEDRLRLEEKLLKYCSASNKCHNTIKRDTRSNSEVPTKYPQTANEFLRQRFYEYCREKARIRNINPPPQEGTVNRSESRIPVLHTRERGTLMKEGSVENLGRRGAGIGEGSRSGITLNEIPRRIPPGSSVTTADGGGGFNRLESRDANVGYSSMYQRRRRLVERNAFQGLQASPDVTNQFSFPGQRYGLNGPPKKLPDHIDRDPRTTRGRVDAVREPVMVQRERESALPKMGNPNQLTVQNRSRGLSHSLERRKRSQSRSQERRYDDETKPTPFIPKTSAARDTYGTMYQRRRRLIEGNAFLALQNTMNGTSYYPQQMHQYSQHPSERVTPPHVADRSSRTEAARESVQKLPDRDQGMTEIPTVNLNEIKIGRGGLPNSEKRLRRPRSRSEENRIERNNDTKINSFSPHNSTTRNLDKAVVDDADYDTQRRASSRSSVYEIQSTSSRNSQYQVTRSVHDVIAYEGTADRPVSADSSNSNISVTESNHSEIRRLNNEHQHSQDENQSSNSPASHNSRSSTPNSQRNAAFDLVPFHTVPSRRNSVNSYVISLNSKKSNLPDESIAVEITDEDLSSSDVEVDEHTDEQSVQDKLSHDFENLNAEDDTDDTFDAKLTRTRGSIRVPISSAESEFARNVSKESIRNTLSLNKSADSPRSSQSFQQLDEEESDSSSKRYPISGESRETVLSNRSIDRNLPRYEVSANDATTQHLANFSPKSSDSFAETVPDIADEDGEAILSTVLPDDTGSIQSLGSRSFQELDRPELYSNSNSASMVRSSQSHSNEDIKRDDDSRELDHALVSPELKNSKNVSRTPSAKDVTSAPQSTEISTPNKSNLSENSESRNAMDLANGVASKIGQSLPPEASEPSKNQPSKVPRMKPKPRVNSLRANPPASQNVSKPSEKPKAIAQLCFNQLESKDWEVVVKGLKTLSQIARQNPAQLESWGPGTLGRVLGRHVRNLRSQVSRAACLAAGEVFMSQPKGIEQEIDDIAGSLFHRTADTNKFLRADSNAALDRLAENISPNKTIAVIIHRGAAHQNAVVRATSGRLLSDVVNRIGPDQAMTLPREVRDKLLVTGAKLLIDGQLDARNYGKKIFRALSHCEGFQKALKDAVPETTLRHIDKTLRTL